MKFLPNSRKSTSQRLSDNRKRSGRWLSQTDVGHTLHSGETVFNETWELMLIAVADQLPHLDPTGIHKAVDLFGNALWIQFSRADRQRMGRCLLSFSLTPGSSVELVPNRGKSLWPRRYRRCLLGQARIAG